MIPMTCWFLLPCEKSKQRALTWRLASLNDRSGCIHSTIHNKRAVQTVIKTLRQDGEELWLAKWKWSDVCVHLSPQKPKITNFLSTTTKFYSVYRETCELPEVILIRFGCVRKWPQSDVLSNEPRVQRDQEVPIFLSERTIQVSRAGLLRLNSSSE